MSERHVLVVAGFFPPFGGGAVVRALQFVRHLSRRRYRVTVVTAKPAAGERRDEGLLATVPPQARVLRVPLLDSSRLWASLRRALPARRGSPSAPGGADPGRALWRDLAVGVTALPDHWMPWIPLATARAALALRRDRPDLVFSTSPPDSVHLVARALAGLLGAPLVVDFRDPWIGNPFRRPVPIVSRASAALERRVVEAAAEVVLNTPALERRFRERYPALTRVRTIPNGFDPEAFAGLPAPAGGAVEGRVEVAHYGRLYGLRSGRFVLEALAWIAREDPATLARLRIAFFGPIEGEAGFRARVADLGLADAVAIHGTLDHRETLARQRRSDVLLVLGPESVQPEVQVPGKLYEYFAARRPILALSRRGGAIEEILGIAGVAHERAEPSSPRDIAEALARIVRAWEAPSWGGARAEAPESFRYDRLGDRLIECFEDAWRGRPRPPVGERRRTSGSRR